MLRPYSIALPKAILSAFAPISNGETARSLTKFSQSDWDGLGSWLHASGLALYLLDTLRTRGIEGSVPAAVLQGLQQNLDDNRKKTVALASDFVALNQAFTAAGLDYVCVKGFSLGDPYVKNPELRSQFDLDFWVSEHCAAACAALMRSLGFAVLASKRTLECHSGQATYPKLRDFYKPPVRRTVEIHLQPNREFADLPRDWGELHGTVFPTLTRERVFLEQALHLTKHLCSEWTRASWMLEFWNAATSENLRTSFESVQCLCTNEQRVLVGIAVAACAHVFQSPVPNESRWAVNVLPAAVKRWIEEYAIEVLIAQFPGTKLYLLLERELRTDKARFEQKRRAALWPRGIPGYIARNGGGWADFISHGRYARMRLAFHVREGVRLCLAERRWAEETKDASTFKVSEREHAA